MRKQNIFNIILFILIIIILIFFLEYINITYLRESFGNSKRKRKSESKSKSKSDIGSGHMGSMGSMGLGARTSYNKKKYRCKNYNYGANCDQNEKAIFKCLNEDIEINNNSEINACKMCEKPNKKYYSETMANNYKKTIECKKKPVNGKEPPSCIPGDIMGYKCIDDKEDIIKEHPGWKENVDTNYDFCLEEESEEEESEEEESEEEGGENEGCEGYKLFGYCLNTSWSN